MEKSAASAFDTVEVYIAAQPEAIRPLLLQVRESIIRTVPEAKEKISWGMPTFTLRGKNLVHFAAQKAHLGFYPGPETIAAFSFRLAGYKTSKGAVQFPYNATIPVDLICDMVHLSKSLLDE